MGKVSRPMAGMQGEFIGAHAHLTKWAPRAQGKQSGEWRVTSGETEKATSRTTMLPPPRVFFAKSVEMHENKRVVFCASAKECARV